MSQKPSRKSIDDRDLETLFAAQRQTDSESAPAFEEILDRAPTVNQRPKWRPVWALAAIAVLAFAAWLLVPKQAPPSAELRLSTSLDFSWQAPSDFLLETSSGLSKGTLPNSDGGLLAPLNTLAIPSEWRQTS